MGGHTFRVNLFHAGVKQILHAFGKQFFLVGGERPRIFIEILVGTELQRVHENTDDDNFGGFLRTSHQIEMAFMQVAHRRNKGNAFAGPLFSGQCRA